MLRDPSPQVREQAVAALVQIGPPATPVLVEALKAPDPAVQGAAARTLEQIGPPAAPAVPALVEALKARDTGVKEAAARALEQIGPSAPGGSGVRGGAESPAPGGPGSGRVDPGR
jgi:HEAT repeat protein